MKKPVLYSLAGAFVLLFCIGIGLLYGRVRQEQAQAVCTGLEVSFADSLRFVSEDDVRSYLDERYGHFVGERLDSVGLSRIEELLEGRSPVMRCEAWTTDDGLLHVGITQRAPALRFQDGNTGFYVDAEGYIFPLHETFTAHVTTVEGSIPFTVPAGYKGEAPDEHAQQWIRGVLSMSRYLSASRTWQRNITKIQVRDGGDILLTLEDRPERFIIGLPEDIPDKLARIGRYLTLIAPYKPEGYYKTVNVKYNQQIICRQKDT